MWQAVLHEVLLVLGLWFKLGEPAPLLFSDELWNAARSAAPGLPGNWRYSDTA
jgi:hypothetical protein